MVLQKVSRCHAFFRTGFAVSEIYPKFYYLSVACALLLYQTYISLDKITFIFWYFSGGRWTALFSILNTA